jgi:uncharacterized protein YmfQ (DUF2313 family)
MEIRKPVRVSHRYTQHINAGASKVLPLLCPVREREWIPGWDPMLVITESGVAEPGAVFLTEVEGREATWLITEHDPGTGRISMVEIVPSLVVIALEISVRTVGPSDTACDVSHTYTALSPDGEAFVRERTPEWYQGFMTKWEELLNVYLASNP